MGKARQELRFAAGRPDGRRSRVWRLWTTRSEVYFTVRTAGSIYKVSIHSQLDSSSGRVCQLSLTGEFLRSLPPEEGLPKGTRHLARWTPLGPDSRGLHLAAKLLLPEEGLAEGAAPDKPITWLPDPLSGETVEVRFLVGGAAAVSNLQSNSKATRLAEWPLENGEVLLVLAYVRPLSPQEREAVAAFKARARDEPTWSSGTLDWSSENVGMLLHGVDGTGAEVIIDLVPSDDLRQAAV